MEDYFERYDKDVTAAVEEAKRFIARAEEYTEPKNHDGKTRAAMKRASMDLTRALVKVRGTTWNIRG